MIDKAPIMISDYTKKAIEGVLGKETGLEFYFKALHKEGLDSGAKITIETGNHEDGPHVMSCKYFKKIKNALGGVDCGFCTLHYRGATKSGNRIVWVLEVKKKKTIMNQERETMSPGEIPKEEIPKESILKHIEKKEPVAVEVDEKEFKTMITEDQGFSLLDKKKMGIQRKKKTGGKKKWQE